MLSDSIFTVISALLNEIKYYSKAPFEYGTEHKAKFIEALANLYFVMHTLDGVPFVDMNSARITAYKAWDEALQTEDKFTGLDLSTDSASNHLLPLTTLNESN